MRKAFIHTLEQLAADDPTIFLLTGDLGFEVLEEFRAKFPKRFFNMGVAEQNMVGVAAGMALSGKKPFCYTIATFMTMRCFEQVRNDVALHNTDVKLVGVGGGFSYSWYGPTHHPLEDIAVMRSLPNMTIVCPADPLETEVATAAIAAHRGPVYFRLGKKTEPAIHTHKPHFEIGRALPITKGSDVAIITTGPITYNALQAAEELKKRGISVGVYHFHTVKPLDTESLFELVERIPVIITLEEASVIGGLGSAVAEALAAHSHRPVHFERLGTPDQFVTFAGTQAYMHERFGLSAPALTRRITDLVSTKKSSWTKNTTKHLTS